MLKYYFAAVLAVAGVASPVHAQDAEPAVDKAATGFRVEVIGGIEDTSFDSATDGTGFLYGIGAGYDIAAGRFRFGVEAEASDSTVSECFMTGTTNVCSHSGRDLYVGARAGGMISSNVLLYAKAGYTHMRQSTASDGPVGGFPAFDFTTKYEGLRLGAGTEVAVGKSMFVKAEYRFSNYEAIESFDKHQGVVGIGLRF